jgi:hypothetical protein
MSRLLSMPITYVIGGLFLLALVTFILSLLQLRRARRGEYWHIRKSAGQRGGQLFFVALTLFALTCAVAFFSGLAAVAVGEFNDRLTEPSGDQFPGIALPSATFTPNFPTPDVEGTVQAAVQATANHFATLINQTEIALQATFTPSPLTPTATTSITPTATTTLTITPTPTPTFDTVLYLTPPPSERRPRPDAAIGITAASAQMSADQTGEVFPVGIPRIYFFIGYQNMDNGLTWTRILYREGVPVQGNAYTWTLDEAGTSFFFFGRADGYPPGNYEVRLFLGVAEVSRFQFTVEAAD